MRINDLHLIGSQFNLLHDNDPETFSQTREMRWDENKNPCSGWRGLCTSLVSESWNKKQPATRNILDKLIMVLALSVFTQNFSTLLYIAWLLLPGLCPCCCLTCLCVCVTCLTLSDGLVDCMDPDCCLQATCHTTSLCVGSPDPLDIIQETQMSSAQSNLQTFYERVHFLVGRDSTHIIPGANPFDGMWVTCALLPPDSTQCTLV